MKSVKEVLCIADIEEVPPLDNLIYNMREMGYAEVIATLQSVISETKRKFLEHQARNEDKLVRLASAVSTLEKLPFGNLLTDVNERFLRFAAAIEVGIKYLSDWNPAHHVSWPVSGFRFGKDNRLLVNLAVSWRENEPRKNVIFVLDTHATRTYICAQAMRACQPPHVDGVPEKFNALIHGIAHEVYCSPASSSFYDLNVLGTDFLSAARVTLTVNYDSARFSCVLARAGEVDEKTAAVDTSEGTSESNASAKAGDSPALS